MYADTVLLHRRIPVNAYTLYTVHVQCTLYMYNVHCTCTMYTVHVQCTLYMYNVHCTCTVYTVHVQYTLYVQ